MSDLYISWSEYHHKIEELAVQIYNSHWQFNQIVCIAKGGLRVGDIFCRLFDLPLGILYTKSYGGFNNQVRGEIIFAPHLLTLEKELGNQVLLLDDLVDSGASLEQSILWLKNNYQQDIEEIRTGVIWYKSCSTFKPDYYVDYLPENPWIHQPFEYYETISPAELATEKGKINP